jgi:hypothetical protein
MTHTATEQGHYNRNEYIRQYRLKHWVPFVYPAMFTPPVGWPNITANDAIPSRLLDETTNPIALLTGVRGGGLVVVDVDTQNDGDEARLFELYGEETMRATRIVSTPSGGKHFYFQLPDGEPELRRVIDAGSRDPRFGPGIDLCGDGHHVIAAPTSRRGHPSKPDGDYQTETHNRVQEIPAKLLADWRSMLEVQARTETGFAAAGVVQPSSWARIVSYHHAQVARATETPKGSRDKVLISCIANSLRAAAAVPDNELSVTDVGTDYLALEELWGESIIDLDGKVNRAQRWLEEQGIVWREQDVTLILTEPPESLPPEFHGQFYKGLTDAIVKDAVVEAQRTHKAEVEAARYPALNLSNAKAFLEEDDVDPQYIIRGIWSEQGTVNLASPKKTGKTTLMLELLRALTTGTPFLGRFEVPRKYRVALLDFELGEPMLRHWLARTGGVDLENVFVASLKGQAARFNTMGSGTRRALAQRFREDRIDILLVDPITPLVTGLGLDEDKNAQIRPLLDSLDTFMVDAGLLGLLISTHTGHTNTGRTRGAGAFGDWASDLWSYVKANPEDPDAVRRFSTEGRSGTPLGPFSVEFDRETNTLSAGQEFERESVPEWRATLDALRGQVLTTPEMKTAVGSSHQVTFRNRAQSAGWVNRTQAPLPAEWIYDPSGESEEEVSPVDRLRDDGAANPFPTPMDWA